MTEYRIISRGEGLKASLERGYSPAALLLGCLDTTPEPLLDPDHLERLKDFLRVAPSRATRRSKRQQEEARLLLVLIHASDADALAPEAKEVLVEYVEGKLPRRRGRPNKVTHLMSDEAVLPGLAVELAHAIEIRIEQGLPLDIPKWGVIGEEPDSMKLPLKKRALTIAQKALRDRGFRVPSLGRLRNRLSERGVPPVGFFVNPDSESE